MALTGFISSLFAARYWTLTRVDPPVGKDFKGQFRPEDYTEDFSTEWAELPIPGRDEPAVQWSGGGAQTITFRATFYAETLLDSIESKITQLKRAIAKDDKLGRPPMFIFTWGKKSELVFLRSIGGIRYSELWLDGRVRKAEFSLLMRIVNDVLTIVETDPTKPPHKSRHKPVIAGSTFESVAAREYGDPKLGILLRQESLVAFPKPGETYALPSTSYFARRAVEPVSYSLGSSDEALAAIANVYEARSNATDKPLAMTT